MPHFSMVSLRALIFTLALTSCAVPAAESQAGVAGPLALQPPPGPERQGAVAAPTSEWVCPTAPLSPRFEPTLYVAPDGSDANDGRSEERPLATLVRAAELVAPGDVVWLRGGTYAADVEFTASGTADAPIVVESYPGECAVLDGSSVDGDGRVALKDVSHMVLRNLVVRNSPAEGIYLEGSDDNVLSHLRLHGNHFSGITSLDGDRNLFAYIIAHGNADPRGGDADGISISSGARNHVAYCVVYGNSDDGVDTWRSTDTLVERCIAFRNGRSGGDGNGFKAGPGRGTADTVVRYSIAFENRSNGFDYNGGRGVVFERNTAFGNDGYGFVASHTALRGNLAQGNGAGPWYGEGGSAQGNSWQVGMPGRGLASAEPTDPSFLALGGSASAGLGALAPGETIGEAIGIDLARLLD